VPLLYWFKKWVTCIDPPIIIPRWFKPKEIKLWVVKNKFMSCTVIWAQCIDIMLCIEKACFKDIVLKARISTVEINTLPNSTSRQCIQTVVYQLPMLQIFSLEQVGNSSSIILSYNWTHSENPIAIILLLSSCWISGCYVINNLCRISCNRIFRHFYSLFEKWVCGVCWYGLVLCLFKGMVHLT